MSLVGHTAAMDVQQSDQISHDTLDSLELRLRHLQFLLTGSNDVFGLPQSDERKQTVQLRLQRMEESMIKLSNSSSAVADLLRLCKMLIQRVIKIILS